MDFRIGVIFYVLDVLVVGVAFMGGLSRFLLFLLGVLVLAGVFVL